MGDRSVRMPEREARTLLMIRAVDDTDHDGVLLSSRTRAAVTRRVFDDGARDDPARLRKRASLLRDDLLREAPALERVLDPPKATDRLVLAVVLVGAVIGALSNLLGSRRHVSILAFPLAAILFWNLLVYAALIVRVIVGLTARRGSGRLAFVGRWLEEARLSGLARRLGASTRSAAIADAVARFQRLWIAAAMPLVAARIRIVLHLAAFAMASGAIAGLYASGIAFEYRATWESTWLDPPTVQRYLDTALGPASRVLGMPVPDVAPLRGPAGEGDAKPWIHLWAATLGLFVLVPRAALALVEALNAARLARWLPVPLDAAYVRRALHSGRGAASVVEIVYYSCDPEAELRERLHTTLQEQAGARAVIRDASRLEYGDSPDRVSLPEDSSGLLVLVFPLAQTPEVEVHGEFLERVLERAERGDWQVTVVLDSATYRQRVGSEERVRERRATWDRLLRDAGVTVMDLA